MALLAGGDVLALFLFSAIGRFNHGFSVFDVETLRTADPFIAGEFVIFSALSYSRNINIHLFMYILMGYFVNKFECLY